MRYLDEPCQNKRSDIAQVIRKQQSLGHRVKLVSISLKGKAAVADGSALIWLYSQRRLVTWVPGCLPETLFFTPDFVQNQVLLLLYLRIRLVPKPKYDLMERKRTQKRSSSPHKSSVTARDSKNVLSCGR
jgi:hypothetical protein